MKMYDPNSRKWEKPRFGPDLGTFGPNSGRQFFFLKIWLRQSLDIMVSYHRIKYQKKTNDPILKNLLTEEWMDGGGRTHRRTDGRE